MLVFNECVYFEYVVVLVFVQDVDGLVELVFVFGLLMDGMMEFVQRFVVVDLCICFVDNFVVYILVGLNVVICVSCYVIIVCVDVYFELLFGYVVWVLQIFE